MNLEGLDTPAAIVAATRMARNIARMQQRITRLGSRFRPHVKTTKCPEIVRRQLAAGAAGITVSTLKEASEFFAAGITDILYAVCIAPNKLDQALALCRAGCRLTLLVDSTASAQALVDKGRSAGHAFAAMIEIDTDGHRSGVQSGDPALVAIGRLLHEGGAVLAGVLTHAGSAYDLDTPAALASMAEQERSGCVRAADACCPATR